MGGFKPKNIIKGYKPSHLMMVDAIQLPIAMAQGIYFLVTDDCPPFEQYCFFNAGYAGLTIGFFFLYLFVSAVGAGLSGIGRNDSPFNTKKIYFTRLIAAAIVIVMPVLIFFSNDMIKLS